MPNDAMGEADLIGSVPKNHRQEKTPDVLLANQTYYAKKKTAK